MIEPLGLVVTLAVLTVVTAWAGADFRIVETGVLAVALIAFSVGVFVYLLGLPLALWPASRSRRWTSSPISVSASRSR